MLTLENIKIKIVGKYPRLLKFFNLPEKIIKSILKWHPEYYIHLNKKQKNKTQSFLVKTYSSTVGYIENPSEKIQFEAINSNSGSIMYIANPTERVQLKAVKYDAYNIKYISNPTEKAQLEVIRHGKEYFKYIKNPTERIKLICL